MIHSWVFDTCNKKMSLVPFTFKNVELKVVTINGKPRTREIFRQKFIEEQLQCTFVRYNPDDKDFDMALVLNKIYRTIIKK